MKKVFSLFALAIAAFALVACGSSSNSTTTNAANAGGSAKGGTNAGPRKSSQAAGRGGGSTINVSSDPSGQLKFNTTKLTAKAGQNTFAFTNQAPISHDFTIETSSGQKVGNTPIFTGGTKSFTANLKPGTYKFLCTVPGHAAAGMQGTLTVK